MSDVKKADANKAIARRYYNEIMNAGNPTAISQLIASDFTIANPPYPSPEPGPASFQALVESFRTAFPDSYFNLDTVLAEGDTVMVSWTCQGRHLGDLHTSTQAPPQTKPASGKPFTLTGMTWLHIAHAQIKAAIVTSNALGMMMQLGLLAPPTEAPPPPPTEANKAIVTRYFTEIMSQGKLEVIDELMTEDFVIRIAGLHDPFHGAEGMKQFVTGLRSAFADIQFTIEALVADGDHVACRFTSFSTHRGEFAGVPPTGNAVSDRGTDVFHLVNGKIASVLVTDDAFGVMQQIGAIPKVVF